jgi:hypothetical protein
MIAQRGDSDVGGGETWHTPRGGVTYVIVRAVKPVAGRQGTHFRVRYSVRNARQILKMGAKFWTGPSGHFQKTP